ncbi:hypothetical protein JCM6882_002942 [Rhodosporidiobolus microsporus]
MQDSTASPSSSAAHPPSSDFPAPSLTVTLRCTSVPSNDSTSSTPATHVSSVPVPRPSSLSAALSAVRSSFPHLASAASGAFYLERVFVGADAVKMTDELWAVFAFLPSEAGAVYRVVDEKKPKEEEEDVKPVVKQEEDEEPVRKRRRGHGARRSEGAPSPQPEGSAGEVKEGLVQKARVAEQRVLWLGELDGSDEEFGPNPGMHLLRIVCPDGEHIRLKIRSTTRFSKVFAAVAEAKQICMGDIRFMFDGMKIQSQHTASDFDMDDSEAVVDFTWEVKAGKPVIYLFPPTPTPLPDVQVSLTLSPQWHFSALYPIRDVIKSKDGASTVVWTVDAGPNSQLVDKKSGIDLSYLFWEAVAERSSSALSTPSLASNGIPAFDPLNPSLTASNGAALPLSLFLPYLDKILFDLSLHTSARTDFITFWLPHFNRIASRAQHIAFRFLPQREYEQAARIEVDPRPDVVTRVFLLFKGVEASEAGEWRKAESVDWVKEVGVDPDEVANEALFRVLEWGGMEVLG